MPLAPSLDLRARVRAAFRSRVSGDPSGAPDWVREIATVGSGPGWFEPDGVVWSVHGDVSTLVGGVAALLGQAAHPLAMAGVARHSSYRSDPWGRLSGTARWIVVTTFGSAELAERESARVRAMHERVRGRDAEGRAYSAGDPDLLRWVHLAFTDAFLHAQLAVGADLRTRFGASWPDRYVADWARSARALGGTDLPASASELEEALRDVAGHLEPAPSDVRRFLAAPGGLGRAEEVFYRGLVAAGELVVSPVVAGPAGVAGRGRQSVPDRLRLAGTRTQLRLLRVGLGAQGPSVEAARYRIGRDPRPDWLPEADELSV